MINIFTNFWISFLAGLFAPLAAVCVLPLYPGFLAYLSNQLTGNESRKSFIIIGLTVTVGVISSMFLFGLIFTSLLQESLTNAIGIISPIAFGILGIISLLLIFNFDIGKFFPKIHAPVTKNPLLSSFIFGFFFGAIVLPCNPASLVVLFALSTSTVDFLTNLLNFIFFGIGMAFPLLVFSIISASYSKAIINFLSKYKSWINRISGILMLIISLYYLIFVFRIFG
ncbi:cytochrome C biogenesis protein [Candidatus Pacearchaeota archaeon]|nr:cytochrome C biogenesis protein [Candidatus Pacearchaeota archaeon]